MMAVKRYELNDGQWAKVAPLLPGKASDPGRTGSDNRLFVNGCLWVLRSGAHWCDLPGRRPILRRMFEMWVSTVRVWSVLLPPQTVSNT
ncbi:transposase [Novosphingobium album (ex Liu et al. 2023)]|uniref:transposase n=1 Tax=Novosphingobium album (ex Liu et al. 2023) TaxID=3031130 RepID=UPI003D16E8D8